MDKLINLSIITISVMMGYCLNASSLGWPAATVVWVLFFALSTWAEIKYVEWSVRSQAQG